MNDPEEILSGENEGSWWSHDPINAAQRVRQFSGDVREWRSSWLAAYHRQAEMYEREIWQSVYSNSATSSDGNNTDMFWWRGDHPPSDNLNRANITTLKARLFGGSAPKLQVSALGGDYLVRLRAQQKTWALASTIGANDAQRVMSDALLDGLKTGFGAVLPEVRGGKFRLTRVTMDDLWWHPVEARDHRRPGDPPRSLHCLTRISKGQAVAMVEAMEADDCPMDIADAVESIRQLPQPSITGSSASNWASPYDRYLSNVTDTQNADQVGLLRSWHLPSKTVVDRDDKPENEHDGVELWQIVALDNNEPSSEGVAIYCDEWTQETHPVVWWSPYPAHQGIVGIGFGSIIEPFQYQHDNTFATADQLIKDWGKPNVALPAEMNDNATKESIAGERTSFIGIPIPGMQSSGKMYEIITHNAQSPELMSYLDRIPEMCSRTTGINPGMAQGGTALSGDVSAVALNAEDNRQDMRFGDVLDESDAFTVNVASQTLHAHDRAHETDPEFSAVYRDRWDDVRDVPWADLRMDPDAYEVKIELVGPRTPAARIREIQELRTLSPEMADATLRAAFRDHDLPGVVDEAASDRDHVEWQLFYLAMNATASENRAEKLAPYWADEITNLDIAEQLSRSELQKAKRQGADDRVVAALTDYRAGVQAMRKSEQPPPPPPGLPMPGMEMGGDPMAAPLGPDGLPLDVGGMMPPGVPPVMQ